MNALNVKMNLIYAFLLVPVVILFFWLYLSGKILAGGAEMFAGSRLSIHAGLILAGAGLGAFYFPNNLNYKHFFFSCAVANLILAAIFAWLASVFLNDQVDLEIDKMTNAQTAAGDGRSDRRRLSPAFLDMFCFFAHSGASLSE